MIPADPKPSFECNTKISESPDWRIGKAEEVVVSEILEPLRRYLKNGIRNQFIYDVKTRSVHMKENYQCERELLQSKLQTLITNARICKVATTQTLISGDMGLPSGGSLISKSQVTEERIRDLLKNHDSQLANRISDLVMQKLAIQKTTEADMKLLRKNMKNEKHAAIRKVKDTQKRYLEKLKENHKMQLRDVKIQHEMQIEQFRNHIKRLQDERKTLSDRSDRCEKELRDLKADSVKMQTENRMLHEENRMLRRNLAKQRVTNENLQKSIFLISELREKLKDSEEAKELILQQFRLLEAERDELVATIHCGIHEVQRANRLGDGILAAEIAKTEGQIGMQKQESDNWSSNTDLSSLQ